MTYIRARESMGRKERADKGMINGILKIYDSVREGAKHTEVENDRVKRESETGRYLETK